MKLRKENKRLRKVIKVIQGEIEELYKALEKLEVEDVNEEAN